MKIPYITHIQKYAIHDGDGIRTTVFFKGCPLSCLWCHNPENQTYRSELMYNKEKCSLCRRCEDLCKLKAIVYNKEKLRMQTDCLTCTLCGECAEVCVTEARIIEGRQYTIKDLIRELEKDKIFYENSNGGITFSGGEVMTQDMDYVERLMEILYRKGYQMNIDTCGYAPFENFERVLPYTNTFLYDIKIMDSIRHKEYTGCDNKLILDNLMKLSDRNGKINIRIPVIEGINADVKSIKDMADFIKENIHIDKVNLLPYHNIGKGKYDQLSRVYSEEMFSTPENSMMVEYAQIFLDSGIANVHMGG